MEYASILRSVSRFTICRAVVDCAEGTLRQFAFQPHGKAYLKANKVTKLFITHMHGTRYLQTCLLKSDFISSGPYNGYSPPSTKHPLPSTGRASLR